ncbi:hypothetical protein PDIG_24460 [Penicillium digitatum PHI26]|uniref:Uncharacterized protein n=2 Tax=Penicillium digitatum TaxID=36651 RepID=K9G430_PEND2|nr:hypothetical protein PDIP_58940 [Penicillium digitatum Pd1]EKV10619.1 hypothetical protein PDIP_58940 [Penicillium digitatum Pd1]EKV15657.1 hypothetical protein PDIG_24460 [Penicillium digitatum PHI26]
MKEVNCERSQPGQTVIESVRHFCLQLGNERAVLTQFPGCSPFLRPLLDKIIEPRDHQPSS